MKRVIVLREKHGDVILDASTDRALHKAALSVVKARFGGPRSHLPEPKRPTQPDIPRDQVSKILNKKLYQAAQTAWRSYDCEMMDYLDDIDFVESIRRCLKQKNGKLAWQILEGRGRYEYEGISLEYVLDVYPE